MMRDGTPISTIILTSARDQDLAVVTRLFAELHAFNASLDARFRLAEGWEPLLREHFLRTHNAPGALWLLAWEGDPATNDDALPLGLLLMEAHTDSPLFAERRWAELVALYVSPAARGGDVGRRLVEAGKTWASTHGFDRMQLYVTATNERARRFYTNCGLYPTQEIWRADVVPTTGIVPPRDPSCDDHYHTEHQMEMGHHHLAMELDVNCTNETSEG